MESDNLQGEQKRIFLLSPVRDFYARFERPISSFSLIGGFIFDAITLKRVDMFWENVWVVVHLIVVAVCILLINRKEYGDDEVTDPSKLHFWLVNILQFFFGGILSTYLVFYFRSGSIQVSWPFIFLLGAAFVANERLKHHFVRLYFQLSLLFLSVYSFSIFLTPVVLHDISTKTFLLSGVFSLMCMIVFLFLLDRYSHSGIRSHAKQISIIIVSLFGLIHALYFLNIIPPIPLSLKDAGIYHSLQRNEDGNYLVTVEDNGWEEYFTLYPVTHILSGDALYAYSAVFSPVKLNTNIVHEWQWYNPETKKWVNEGRVLLSVVGGRDGGYRTYSSKTGFTDGKWRVNVETERGQLIGRLQFMVQYGDRTPELVEIIHD